VANTPPASIADTLRPKKTRKTADLARWTRGRYLCEMRAIEPTTRVMIEVNAARKKALEMARLPALRAMRAAFCELLPARQTLLPSPLFIRID
jgi:hypothetical protein